MATITIHGPGALNYTDRPQITAEFNYTSIRRDGSTILSDVSVSLNGLGGASYFGYNLDIYARIVGGSWVGLAAKANSPSQWGAGIVSGSGTLSAVTDSTSCRIEVGLSSICGCPANSSILPVWGVDLGAPASGFNVTFKSYDGTVLKTERVSQGGSATPPSHPNRSGYTPNGWSGDYTNVTSNRECIAQYIQNRYTVRYSMNGGEGLLGSQKKYGGETLYLHDVTPVHPVVFTLNGNGGGGNSFTLYRTFLGWYCSVDGNIYQPGDGYDVDSSCVMTAQWADVSVDLNKFSPMSPKTSKLTINWMDRVVTIKEETRYHEFLGWYTDPVGGELVTVVTVSSDKQYYAHWDYAKILPVEIIPSKADWNFIDFYTDSVYSPENRVDSHDTMSSSITIYAKWTYNIRMYGNGGLLWLPTFPEIDGVIESKISDLLVKEHNVPITFPDYVIDYDASASGSEVGDKDGQSRDFVNWNSKQNGSGVSYPKIYTYNVNDSAKFYAQWKTKIFKVVFRDGYGSDSSGIIATFNVPYGGSVSEAQVQALGIPKRNGYTFSGWRGSYTSVKSDVTVVAVWNFSPVWIYVSDVMGGHWQGYEPEE